jgi:serine/threonine-protein kinase
MVEDTAHPEPPMADSAAATSPPADLSGRTLGDFQVLRRLGAGGMGQVYLARQLSLKREVALKLLKSELVGNETALKRFQAEAEAVARISHPNIVQVYAVGEQDGLRFMALEYVEGRNLREFLARKGPPELPVALAVIRQVAQALQRASELGIVHRDVKPENILLTRRGEVKVTDFGLSRLTAEDAQPLNLTQSGVTLGTPLYMAPEQVRGQPTDHRTDLYSLGVTCYHLLAGHPPFTGANAMDVAMKHVHEPPPPLAGVRPDLPADLCGIVHRLMAKRPEERYPTAKDVLRDLARVRAGQPVGQTMPVPTSGLMPSLGDAPPPAGGSAFAFSGPAAAPAVAPPANPWPGRAAGGLAVLVTFVGGWWAFGRTHRPADPPPAAAAPGLPADRPPPEVPVVSRQERELAARLDRRGLTLAEVTTTAVELGLLQVRERRWADAERTFARLEAEKAEGRPGGGRPLTGQPVPLHQVAAKFGLGVALAHQDQAEKSVEAFRDGLKLVPAQRPPAERLFAQFLLDHPALAEATAEALDRDLENLKQAKFADARLERLRRPPNPWRGGK